MIALVTALGEKETFYFFRKSRMSPFAPFALVKAVGHALQDLE